MIIETSALVAMLKGETEARIFVEIISGAASRIVCATNIVETTLVVAGRKFFNMHNLDDLISRYRIEIAPFTSSQARLAQRAFLDFGKGRHPAALNFGDCFAYALARETGEPLLCKGNDFPQTDVPLVAWR